MSAEYEVLKIDEMTRISDVGGVEKYYRHQVKTKGGIVFTIDLSEPATTPEKAAPRILKRAIELDKILAL